LDDVKPLKKKDGGSHSEGCEDGNDQDHRMKSLKIGLKQLVLEFFRRSGASQLVMLIAAVRLLMRFVAFKFLFNIVIGMPLITATF
jgi:hypothetical protein